MSIFDEITKEGRLLYQYIRGSQLYGTQLFDENGVCLSDVDTGGVYIEKLDMLYNLLYLMVR